MSILGFKLNCALLSGMGTSTTRLTHPSQQFCMPNLSLLSLETKSGEDADDSVLSRRSNSVSLSLSSVTASTWADVPVIVRYFALWGGRVVYTDR
jgi:hypothetical protein